MHVEPFRWQDGERLVRFGRGTLAEAPDLLSGPYSLLTTARAAAGSREILDGAAAVHHVPDGRVDEVAAGLREAVEGDLLVALGGGRVIDVAKALAAADPPRRVAAIPTTLSAAEMTALHRHAVGVDPGSPRVRPALVLNDPALSASQPAEQLAASAANSLGHAIEAPLTPLANPVTTWAAHEGARLLVAGIAAEPTDRANGPATQAAERVHAHERERGDALALGALLAGYAIGAAGYGLHHVMSQTAVREAGVRHGAANAILLPHTVRALARRFPDRLAAFDAGLGSDAASAAATMARRSGAIRLREVGVVAEQLAACADAAARRPELALTPPAADRDELLAIYEAAW